MREFDFVLRQYGLLSKTRYTYSNNLLVINR